MQSQLNALTYGSCGDNGGSYGGSGGDSGGGAGGGAAGPGIPEDKRHCFNFARESKRKVYNNQNYYHTHGYHITDSRTRKTCQNPNTGHKKDATRADTMGECTREESVCL